MPSLELNETPCSVNKPVIKGRLKAEHNDRLSVNKNGLKKVDEKSKLNPIFIQTRVAKSSVRKHPTPVL